MRSRMAMRIAFEMNGFTMNVAFVSLRPCRISSAISENPFRILMSRNGILPARAATGPHPIESANLHSSPALLQKLRTTRIASAFVSGAAKAQLTIAYTFAFSLLPPFFLRYAQ